MLNLTGYLQPTTAPITTRYVEHSTNARGTVTMGTSLQSHRRFQKATRQFFDDYIYEEMEVGLIMESLLSSLSDFASSC